MRFILVLFVSICFSQNKQSFYFDFNESTFNSIQENDFQNWLKSNSTISIKRIEGYCDSIGTNQYNKKLASKRINYVLERIRPQNASSKAVFFTKPYGEDFQQDSIQSLNRRVDVYYTQKDKTLDEII